MIYLGIDTSNYTTSAAVFNSESAELVSKKRLLKVRDGEIGLRQSEAVFQHTLALPEIISQVFAECGGTPDKICVSVSPRDEAGSYMPCFMCGKGTAVSLGAAFRVPVSMFSHQAGHIAAALYSANASELLCDRFIAFHVSGGTTEAVMVTPDSEKVFSVEIIASSLDLKAGQAVDRVGNILGLSFPSGQALDELACESDKSYNIHPFMRDGSCSLSGVENRCQKMADNGESPSDIAKYCIDYITAALRETAAALLDKYGSLPLLFSGGVMSNSIIRKKFTDEFGAYFAEPRFSSDNAAGIAVLGALKDGVRI